jgi:hypothetical protein
LQLAKVDFAGEQFVGFEPELDFALESAGSVLVVAELGLGPGPAVLLGHSCP